MDLRKSSGSRDHVFPDDLHLGATVRLVCVLYLRTSGVKYAFSVVSKEFNDVDYWFLIYYSLLFLGARTLRPISIL